MMCFMGEVSLLMQFLQESNADQEDGVWKVQGNICFRGGQVSVHGDAVFFKDGKAVLLCPGLIRRVYGIQYVP